MGQADTLLDSVLEGNETLSPVWCEVTPMLADSETEPHIVIGEDRVIVVPDQLKRLAVQNDHNIETVTFDCPRYWDDSDMSTMRIYINYMRSDKVVGSYMAQNIVVDDANHTVMHFDWTISKNVSEVPGKIAFLVCIKKMDENGLEEEHWNSELNKDTYVSEGLETTEPIIEEYPDIIGQWEEQNREMVQVIVDELIRARLSGEFNGATFIPEVSEEGIISWTNDKGLTNPGIVNIHGVSPTVTVSTTNEGHRVSITDVNGTKSFDVMNGSIEVNEAVIDYINSFVHIGSSEPVAGPVLWFDTSTASAE